MAAVRCSSIVACMVFGLASVAYGCSDNDETPPPSQASGDAAISDARADTGALDAPIDADSAALPAVDCSGAWGSPELVLDLGLLEDAELVASPAITGDGLELLFVTGRPDLGQELWLATRTNKSAKFSPSRRLDELDAACTEEQRWRTVDVSADGLRAYFMCDEGSSEPVPVYQAHRASRSEPFSVDLKVGEFPNNAVAMAGGELRAYGDDEAYRSVVAPRSALSQELGPPQPVPGLEGIDGHSPGISEDELEIVLRFAEGNRVNLRSAKRSSTADPFGDFVSVFAGPTGEMAIGAPEFSYDCRSLYFVWVTAAGQGGVYQMSR